jgi:GTP-binding protein Era
MSSTPPPEDAPRAGELPGLGEQPPGFRAGFVAVVGMPNAGKSTLVNALLGREALITSDKPQTTRHQIRCVSTTSERQLLFVDTPGWLRQRRGLDAAMAKEIRMGLEGVDVVLLVIDGLRPDLKKLEPVRQAAAEGAGGAPLVVALTKMDKLGKSKAIPLAAKITEILEPADLVPVSGLGRDNLAALDAVLTGHLPEGPVMYPPEVVVDRPESFLAAEFVREQIFRVTKEEVPFATAVDVRRYEIAEDGTVEVDARVFVDRKSQKGILLGKNGRMIHQIRRKAARRLKEYTGAPGVELELFVEVRKGWRDEARALEQLGIGVEE